MTKSWSSKPIWDASTFEAAIDVSVVAHLRHEYGEADALVMVELTQRLADKGRALQVVASDIEQRSFNELRSAAQNLRIVAGAVGAVEVGQLCAGLERAADDADLASARELCRTLSLVLVRARTALLRLALTERPHLSV